MTKTEKAWWNNEAEKALKRGLGRIVKKAKPHGRKTDKSKLDRLTPAG